MTHLARIATIVFVSIFALTVSVAADQTIYLVRHAEKQNDGTRDPSLTQLGKMRAIEIADMLATAELSRVYSTNYKRTQETASPSAKRVGLSVTPYDPRALPEFAEKLKSLDGTSLVVGHSNTTPALVAMLSGQDFPQLEEYQYDHLYVVTLKDDGGADVRIDYIEPRTP